MDVHHERCAGLEVHKDTVVACARVLADGKVERSLRAFGTTARELLALADWLEEQGCAHVAMEATGVYWEPVWHVLEGRLALILGKALLCGAFRSWCGGLPVRRGAHAAGERMRVIAPSRLRFSLFVRLSCS